MKKIDFVLLCIEFILVLLSLIFIGYMNGDFITEASYLTPISLIIALTLALLLLSKLNTSSLFSINIMLVCYLLRLLYLTL
ncbi:hypothetical protein KIJ05_03315 [Leuconostoc gelidum subsp. gasicomitatum]|uniref:hypothetical protein n=1 Tax=Leuconostoc gasicomitatum TaxID=115778 RepID=UPI001CC6BF19|nr:hypothetical protein [Leuconostoc gasicomitatum]MBZ5984164.1 hypothetical protein [Leuconostoc gasicomitatum]